MTDAQNENENQVEIMFYGIALHELLAIDRVNVDAWSENFSYLNSRALGVVMEIEEVAVNELLTGATLPFAVSEIMSNIESKEARNSTEYPKVNWKRVKRDFERMETQGHIVLCEGNDPSTKKVQYRITTEFRELVRGYYDQFAKSVRMMMARMQMHDSEAAFAELVADNPALISELGLEEDDE